LIFHIALPFVVNIVILYYHSYHLSTFFFLNTLVYIVELNKEKTPLSKGILSRV